MTKLLDKANKYNFPNYSIKLNPSGEGFAIFSEDYGLVDTFDSISDAENGMRALWTANNYRGA